MTDGRGLLDLSIHYALFENEKMPSKENSITTSEEI